jgi:GNAT superfamily N-acetyltransferase
MTSQIFQTKKMELQEVLPLRHRILRPHQTIQDCTFPQDQWPTTFHVGAVSNGQVVSVATFHEEAFAKFPAKLPFRLRGMATETSFQGKGVGRKVLEFGIAELKKRSCDLLWCNAREIAFPFYERMGMKYEGPMFDIPNIGPHKVMYLYLDGRA